MLSYINGGSLEITSTITYLDNTHGILIFKLGKLEVSGSQILTVKRLFKILRIFHTFPRQDRIRGNTSSYTYNKYLIPDLASFWASGILWKSIFLFQL